MKRSEVVGFQLPEDPESVIKANTLYSVALGNGVVVRFPSKRQALAFQAEATRMLTGAMMTANLLLAEAFSAYRMAWPYFAASESSLQVHVRDAEEALDRSCRTYGPNGSHFRWRSVNASINSVRTLAIALAAMYAAKGHAVPKHQAELIIEKCNTMLQELKHYGTEAKGASGYRPSPYTAT